MPLQIKERVLDGFVPAGNASRTSDAALDAGPIVVEARLIATAVCSRREPIA